MYLCLQVRFTLINILANIHSFLVCAFCVNIYIQWFKKEGSYVLCKEAGNG